jgi:hypothetical protein
LIQRSHTPTRVLGIARHHAGTVLLAFAAVGCGPSLGPGAGLLDARFREPRVTQARASAPDLVAAAEAARDAAARAHAAGDAEAADDETTRARLLLEAALVEVERAAAERTRRENERAAETDDEAARRDEEARTELAREAVWRAAARVAEAEQQRALARAQASEPRRGARLPSGDADDARDAARALARRARLLRAAAAALGATPAELAPVDAALTASDAALATTPRARITPAEALAAADEARRSAERALGTARDRAGAPGAEGLAALVETVRLAGLEAQSEERGVVVYAAAFPDRARVPAQAAVGALATVLRTHASGPVLVAHEAPRDAGGARLARERAESLLRALVAAGADTARLRLAPGDAPAPRDGEAPRAALAFPAYAATPSATVASDAPTTP